VRSERKTAIFIGILLIAAIGFGILNSIPALERPDYLTELAAITPRVLIAVFFQAAMACVYLCIAALFYPVIKKYNEALAAGYFGFRIIGAAFLFVGIVSLLLLLTLSQSFVSAVNPDLLYFQTTGELLRIGRDLMNHIGMILPWSLGGLILYYSIYKIKLVPGWLSVWGIASSALTVISTFMLMLGVINIVTPIYFLLNMPTALFELTLAIFLIIRGFNPVTVDL